MELDKFIKNFANQFDETDIAVFEAGTIFKDLEEWSSLTALSIIAMIDNEYGVKIAGSDIKNASKIEDLYNIIAQRK
ncbi:acyl carrier protein [Mucilaginibacter mali]|uniref:Acyl carrier protein n=1 Tax=Mucilaginibacter mali TaxID=2740462 RepID=A0A7D4QE21_9SPHI|nr:acyl carrier protein [Mucilaginibacter mali]QKJ29392.1 acyl carrier protein [Mucilaginibacter mali]